MWRHIVKINFLDLSIDYEHLYSQQCAETKQEKKLTTEILKLLNYDLRTTKMQNLTNRASGENLQAVTELNLLYTDVTKDAHCLDCFLLVTI